VKAQVDVNVICPGCGNIMSVEEYRNDCGIKIKNCLKRGCVNFGKTFIARLLPEVELVDLAPGPAIDRMSGYTPTDIP
jgi:hypothetical protein